MIKRKKCSVEGCKNLSGLHGLNANGTKKYKSKCSTHHRQDSRGRKIKKIKNDECENCGWDKAYCDRHRIKKELGYKEGNVKILCPNCHRLETIGLLIIK
jgi:hypothetical protein